MALPRLTMRDEPADSRPHGGAAGVSRLPRRAALNAARQAAALQVLRARGIAVPERLEAHLADAAPGGLVGAALACRDGADFLAHATKRPPRRARRP